MGSKGAKQNPNKKKKTAILAASLVIAAIALGGGLVLLNSTGLNQEAFASVTVYKSPTCGCCRTGWTILKTTASMSR